MMWEVLKLKVKAKVLAVQSCPTLCNPKNCSPAVSPVHGILRERTLDWVAVAFSRRSSQPRDQTWVSYITGRFFTIWATRETRAHSKCSINKWAGNPDQQIDDYSGLPFPSPGDLPDSGIKPGSPTLQADSLLTELRGKPQYIVSVQ